MSARNAPVSLVAHEATHFAIRNSSASVAPRSGAPQDTSRRRGGCARCRRPGVSRWSDAERRAGRRPRLTQPLTPSASSGAMLRLASGSPSDSRSRELLGPAVRRRRSSRRTARRLVRLGHHVIERLLGARGRPSSAACRRSRGSRPTLTTPSPCRPRPCRASGPNVVLSLSMIGDDLVGVALDPDARGHLRRVGRLSELLEVGAGVDRHADPVTEQRLDVLGQLEAGRLLALGGHLLERSAVAASSRPSASR